MAEAHPQRPLGEDDPRRWITLAIVISSIFIVVLDNSVLNVAIPTILRDFKTTLPSLQWVVTGYALTFATLLIIGGRLGDIFGHRRVFIIGAALFCAGSLLAALSWNVASLILGEAAIEGIGASLMMPTTLAILSNTFSGRERATAFAAWGATAGAGAAFGPVVGGFLTTNYSWRWAFGINVVVAPVAILAAILVIPPSTRPLRRERIDVVGAVIVAVGMFGLVFALSEGGTYGWITPVADMSVARWLIWARTMPVSAIPIIGAGAAGMLGVFYRVERAREQSGRDPLFEFGQLRHRSFRYGLLTTVVLAMGQLGLLFALPVFLQDGRHLSAQANGLWILPTGISVIVGAQLGGRLTRWVGTTWVVRLGLTLETTGLLLVAMTISPSVSFLALFPGLVLYGSGIGFASSQLTNVVLSDIAPSKSGAAGGANTTVRQIGSGLGVAIIGSILTTQTIRHAVRSVGAATSVPGDLRTRSILRLHQLGPNFTPPPGVTARDASTLNRLLTEALSAGTRPALAFAAAVVGAGAALSFFIPQVGPDGVKTQAQDAVSSSSAADVAATTVAR